ncbi:protein-tyrosine phosphatase family protein [Thermococcus sp.]
MRVPVRFIDENVAFSRMPHQREIDELSREFDAVVILVEDFELGYDPGEWNRRKMKVLHFPLPDFSAPSIEDLLKILHWIEERVREGKRVLIHCVGGLGRSGTVAVAWLMYSGKLSLHEALYEVRKIRPRAVETAKQMEILKKFEQLLSK